MVRKSSKRARRTAAAMATVTLLAGAAACGGGGGTEEQRGLVIGKATTTTEALPTSTVPTEPPTTTAPPTTAPPAPPATSAPVAPPPAEGVPDGGPYTEAMFFQPTVMVPDRLVFVLAVGGDARPGGDPRRSNGDAIHLIAVDPRTGSGTILGFPRDSWVNIPGKGTRKINSALALGGPQLMAETVRQLTGLPVDYYVLSAFDGFAKIVDELGGVNVHVDRKMNDRFSGAKFDVGWHQFTGREALAYSRNRHDVPNGDFGRSMHQGNVLLSGLAKLRAETTDDAGLQRWIGVLLKYADLDSPPQQLFELATLARTLDPAKLTNVVVPGRVGNAGSQSVVFLGPEAQKIFADLRPDAVLGGATG